MHNNLHNIQVNRGRAFNFELFNLEGNVKR